MSYTAELLTHADLLATLRLTGARVRTYDDWQAVGRQVRRGERIRHFYVEHAGKRWCVAGFEESQLYPDCSGYEEFCERVYSSETDR